MPVAVKSPRPAQPLIAIGNHGNRCLWRFSCGSVRQVYQYSFAYPSKQQVDARVLEMTVPTSGGDSGGPILNRRGELVGITVAGSTPEAETLGIDVSEIWAFLRRRDISATLLDVDQSVFGDTSARLAYQVYWAQVGKADCPVTQSYAVTVNASQRHTGPPLPPLPVASLPSPPQPDLKRGLFRMFGNQK